MSLLQSAFPLCSEKTHVVFIHACRRFNANDEVQTQELCVIWSSGKGTCVCSTSSPLSLASSAYTQFAHPPHSGKDSVTADNYNYSLIDFFRLRYLGHTLRITRKTTVSAERTSSGGSRCPMLSRTSPQAVVQTPTSPCYFRLFEATVNTPRASPTLRTIWPVPDRNSLPFTSVRKNPRFPSMRERR